MVTITFHVYDAVNATLPVVEATVSLNSYTGKTDSTGTAIVNVPEGDKYYTLTVSHPSYVTFTVNMWVPAAGRELPMWLQPLEGVSAFLPWLLIAGTLLGGVALIVLTPVRR